MSQPQHVAPSSEVVPKAKRRTFTAEYKRKVLTEADGCKGDPGAIGALLRREGLYSSHLTTWRRERERAELESLASRRRGPKPHVQDERDVELAWLRKDVAAWQGRAERAELLCDIQKKVASLLGIRWRSCPKDSADAGRPGPAVHGQHGCALRGARAAKGHGVPRDGAQPGAPRTVSASAQAAAA